MGTQGWVKVYRKLLANPIMHDAKLLQVFLYCLLKANHKGQNILFNGQIIEVSSGSFIAGRNVASQDLRLKSNMWDRKLKLLEKLKIVNTQKTNRYTIVSIVKWHEYQCVARDGAHEMNSGMNSKTSNGRTTKEQQKNIDKKVNKLKEYKEGRSRKRPPLPPLADTNAKEDRGVQSNANTVIRVEDM